MAHCSGLQAVAPGHIAEASPVGLPIYPGSFDKVLAINWQMMGFTQEVGHGKADVEGGIAKMDHLVVEQKEIILMDKYVLGTVIAMY